MERIAIPIFQSRISPVLDACNDLVLVDLSETGAVRRANVSLQKLSIGERAAAMSRQGVEKIICAGVSDLMIACIVSRGMHVISGLSGEVEQIIAAYQQDRLDQDCFRMPGGKKSESPSPPGSSDTLHSWHIKELSRMV
jgi:predicted Fe-Mo cluster-binding NifX family protein